MKIRLRVKMKQAFKVRLEVQRISPEKVGKDHQVQEKDGQKEGKSEVNRGVREVKIRWVGRRRRTKRRTKGT